jgi:hypothetical protein
VARIEASLVRGGFTVSRDSVSGRQATIGRSGGLRGQLFVLVAVFKAGMGGREHLNRFLDEAGQYAATVKRGWAGRAAAVAVAVVEPGGGDEREAAAWARTPPARPAAGRATAFPALVDLVGGRLVCPDAPADLRAATIRAVGLDPG